MTSADGSALLARLSARDFPGLAAEISSFLHPFQPFLSPAAAGGGKSRADPTLLRPLAKQFLPFLSALLKHLAAALPPSFPAPPPEAAAGGLFAAYRLALDCLECLSPCLSGKPYSVQLLRVRLVRCLEGCGKIGEAEREGFAVLESLKSVVTPNPPRARKGKKGDVGRYMPAPSPDVSNEELAFGVAETAVCLIDCVHRSESTDAAVYRRALVLVEQVEPWISVLEPKVRLQFRGALVKALYKCVLVMLANSNVFDGDLTHQFCMIVLKKCPDSSAKDQFLKMARKICSCYDWKQGHSLVLDILRCCLDLLLCECKVNLTSIANEVFDCLHFILCKCRDTNDSLCEEVAELLRSFEPNFSQMVHISVIFSAHISGLYSVDIDIRDRLQCLAAFDPLENLLCNGAMVRRQNLELCRSTHGVITLSSYVCAFDLLCNSLSESVNTIWKPLSTVQEVPFYSNIDLVQDIFHYFCEAFIAGIKSAVELERKKLHESRLTVLHVSMAAFRVFLRTNRGPQKSVGLINSVISSNWIGPKELRYLASALYNTGVSFINLKDYPKASLCLELCYSALWTHISHQCRCFSQKSGDISEESIKDYVSDACTTTAIYLGALHECCSPDINKLIVDSLSHWAKARDLLNVAGPDALVKKWVKIMCKLGVNADLGLEVQSLCHLIPSHFDKETVAIILEQELSAYREMEARSPDLCIKMQLKITSILLQDVYTTRNYYLQKSILLINQGRLLRASGIDGLKSCIECLSEAIKMLKDELNGSAKEGALVCHHLALTYCLRAMCLQEMYQAFEVIFDDISCATKLWSSIMVENLLCEDHPLASEIDKALPLLYHIADLLSMKGCLDHHFEIYKLIINIGIRNNVPLDTSLATLWCDRRLNHCLCTSPIDDGLLLKLSSHFGSHILSLDFWINCTEQAHPSSLLGFVQCFLVHNLKWVQEEKYSKVSASINVSTNSIKEAARALLSSVPKLSQKAFFAGHLYYDLAGRLISNGQLYEALSIAREALLIRTRFLHKKFIYFDQIKVSEEELDGNQNHLRLEVSSLPATEVWPCSTQSQYSEQSVLSSWNVLKCYLESCFQVGIVHELMGNAVDAEAFLQMGKKISCLHGLLLFRVAFGSMLGRIYCKKQKLDLAESELENCRRILHDCNMITSCMQCKLALDVSLDLQYGDAIRTRSTLALQLQQSKDMAFAVHLYTESLEKLNISEHDYIKPTKCDINKALSKGISEKQARTMRSSKAPRGKSCLSSKHHKNVGQEHMAPKADVRFGEKNEICLPDVIIFKWEYNKRRLALHLLLKIGKCANCFSEIHEVHKKFCQGASLLFSGHPIPQTSLDFLKLMGEDISDDIFVVERATLLYEISWLSLKLHVSKQSSKFSCCDLSNIEMSMIMSWLMQAFIISRELPVLFQKISRLLATVFLLFSASGQSFLAIYCSDSLSSCHWAAFFHQASIGAHFHSQYSSANKGKHNSFNSMNCEGISSTCTSGSDTLLSVRSFPENVKHLSKFVNDFFIDLPSLTIVCMSMLGGGYGDLIMELLHLPSSFPAWLLFTRFFSKKRPVVMLLPIDTVVEETENNDEIDDDAAFIETKIGKKWGCPWGYSLIDKVIPQFKSILEENYLSSSNQGFVNTKENRILWWTRRTRLNDRLDILLKNLEYLWLGPWRCLFLGERLDDGHLDGELDRLMVMLKDKYDFDAHEELLKIILSGDLTPSQREECVSQFLLYRGYFGRGGSFGEKRWGLFSSFSMGVEDECGHLRQPFLDAISKVEVKVTDRHPVVLVMEAGIQMLPWESLPVMRLQEVYRMPSVGSIHALLKQPMTLGLSNTYPSVDPSNAYFLLNPSGDLSYTQLEFEEWFKSQKWEGRVGDIPTSEELAAALESRDLFIYFGHGSGNQYISGQKIQMLERCAATLLMGCSSGSLIVNGTYAPLGAPIFYLLAGSPAIVSNLWDVTDRDIDRFGKVVVDAWLQETSRTKGVCESCNHVVTELESLTIGNKRNCSVAKTRRKAPKGKKAQDSENCTCKENSKSASLASFMAKARDACTLPFLVGASPVCYGVPTMIRRKKL